MRLHPAFQSISETSLRCKRALSRWGQCPASSSGLCSCVSSLTARCPSSQGGHVPVLTLPPLSADDPSPMSVQKRARPLPTAPRWPQGRASVARPLSRSHRVKVIQEAGCDRTGTGSGGRGWCCRLPVPALQGCPRPQPSLWGLRWLQVGTPLCSVWPRDAHRALHVMKAVPLERVHTGAQDGAQPPCLWTGAWIRNAQHPGIHGGTIQPRKGRRPCHSQQCGWTSRALGPVR